MSTIKVDTIQNTSGVSQYMGKAWANWNADTLTFRSSGNISSLTDHGSGSFSLNLSSALTAAEGSACSAIAFENYTNVGSTPNSFQFQQASQRLTTVISYSSYSGGFYDASYSSVTCVA